MFKQKLLEAHQILASFPHKRKLVWLGDKLGQ